MWPIALSSTKESTQSNTDSGMMADIGSGGKSSRWAVWQLMHTPVQSHPGCASVVQRFGKSRCIKAGQNGWLKDVYLIPGEHQGNLHYRCQGHVQALHQNGYKKQTPHVTKYKQKRHRTSSNIRKSRYQT